MKNKYKHLAINSNNELIIIMPVITGDTIGLDNTCKAGEAISSFLHGDNSVFVSLQRLKDDIENKYLPACKNYSQFRKLEKLWKQVISCQEEKNDFRFDGSSNSSIPTDVLDTLLADPYVGAIGLDPKGEDNSLSFRGISACSFGIRKSEGRHEQKILSTALRQFFKDNKQQITEKHNKWKAQFSAVDNKTWKASVLDELLNSFQEKVVNPDTLQEILNFLNHRFQSVGSPHIPEQLFRGRLAAEDYPGDHNKNDEICEYYRNTLKLDDGEDLYTTDIIPSIKSFIEWDNLEVFTEEREKGVFERIHESGKGFEENINARDIYEERMSIAIQFLIGTINLVLKRKGETTSDFGMVIEGVYVDDNGYKTRNSTETMLESLLDWFSEAVSREAFSFIDQLPDVIMRWMNENRVNLAITGEITDEDIKEITFLFSGYFETIQGSPHFDEFLIRQKGGSIWINVEDVIATDFRNIKKYGSKKDGIEVPDMSEGMRYLSSELPFLKDILESNEKFQLSEEVLNEFKPDRLGELGKMFIRKMLLPEILKDGKEEWIEHYKRLGFLNEKYENGETALMIAAKYGHQKSVNLLLAQEGLERNVKNNRGETALMIAARSGKSEVVKVLIAQEGLERDVKDNRGETALMIAARYGKSEVIKVLIAQEGFERNVKNNSGDTVLMLAVRYRWSEVVKVLIAQKGIDLNTKNNRGDTVLMLAAKRGRLEVVKVLIAQKGIDLNTRNDRGDTVLMLAAEKGYLEVVKVLLASKGIKKNLINDKDETALMIAVKFGYLEIVETLIEQNDIDLNQKDEFGYTAMMLAVNENDIDVVRLLSAKSKLALNERNKYGETALMLALRRTPLKTVISKEQLEIIKILIDAGSNIYEQDNTGDSIYEIAKRMKNPDIFNMIKNASAVKIQALHRGSIVRHKKKNSEIISQDKSLSDSDKLNNSGPKPSS